MRIRLPPYGFIRIPYGRSRPIDFDRSHFYAQHLDDEELARFLNKIGSTSIASTKTLWSRGATGSVPRTNWLAWRPISWLCSRGGL